MVYHVIMRQDGGLGTPSIGLTRHGTRADRMPMPVTDGQSFI